MVAARRGGVGWSPGGYVLGRLCAVRQTWLYECGRFAITHKPEHLQLFTSLEGTDPPPSKKENTRVPEWGALEKILQGFTCPACVRL